MIITFTANPSIDRTLTIPTLRFNEVLRTQDVHLDWGGKGINVSRCLRVMGHDSLALGWVGGSAGKMLAGGLQSLGIETDFVWVEGETRTNTMIQEANGEKYVKVNEPGPNIPREAIAVMTEKALSCARKDDLWVIAGSLPPSVPESFYADLISKLQQKGVRIFFDASEKALQSGCLAAPFLVKPNAAEAESVVGFPIRNAKDAKRAASHFIQMGILYVALSLEEQGLLLASPEICILATPPKVQIRNVTGAGDALLAGLVHAFSVQFSLQEAACWGVACGLASVMHAGISEVSLDEIADMLPRVAVQSL